MAGSRQTAGHGLVLGGPAVVERARIHGPLLEGARARDDGRDGAAVEHPGDGPLHERDAARVGVGLELAGDVDALRAPFRFHHAPVFAGRSCAFGGCDVVLVFAGEDAARDRAVSNDAEAEVAGGRQHLCLRLAVHQIVVGLQGRGARDVGPVTEVRHVRDSPGANIREAPFADLAVADQQAVGLDDRFPGRVRVGEVNVVEVDDVGAEAFQTRLAGRHDVAARLAGRERAGCHGIARLRGEHPGRAAVLDQPASDFFRPTVGILIGRINDVDAA